MTIEELFQSGREVWPGSWSGNEGAVDGVLAALVLEAHVLIEGLLPAPPRRCWCARWRAPPGSTTPGSSSRPT